MLSGEDERPAKRRRMSISPEAEDTPGAAVVDDPMSVDDEPIWTPSSSPPDDTVLAHSPAPSEDHSTSDSEERPPPPEHPARQHPTFQAAPRFKAPEQPVLDAQRRAAPLPEAFSPRRRGAKYVPGGLAAELRDWLVQLKGASEYDRPAGAGVRVKVDEAKAGEGMWIVAARHVSEAEGGAAAGDSSSSSSSSARVVLAGDGRVAAGLGGRRTVSAGGTVAMHQPMWDVDLGTAGKLAVACDWEVED